MKSDSMSDGVNVTGELSEEQCIFGLDSMEEGSNISYKRIKKH
jgi:hypothetical protein